MSLIESINEAFREIERHGVIVCAIHINSNTLSKIAAYCDEGNLWTARIIVNSSLSDGVFRLNRT